MGDVYLFWGRHSLAAGDALTSLSLSNNKPFHWNLASHGVNGQDRGIVENNKESITTVVLLGSNHKHLSRYAELYNSRGIPAITFVAMVKYLLSLKFGRRFQRWISALEFELASWLSEREKDGRDASCSSTLSTIRAGLRSYGAILDDLQGRPDLLERRGP